MKGGPVFPQGWIHCANIKIFHSAWCALSSLNYHFPREHYRYPDYLLVLSSPSHPSSPDYETLPALGEGMLQYRCCERKTALQMVPALSDGVLPPGWVSVQNYDLYFEN